MLIFFFPEKFPFSAMFKMVNIMWIMRKLYPCGNDLNMRCKYVMEEIFCGKQIMCVINEQINLPASTISARDGAP